MLLSWLFLLLIVYHILPWLNLLQRKSDSEPLVTFLTIDYYLVLSVLTQVASLNHLAHELGSGLVTISLLFSLLDPASKVGQLSHIYLQLLLLDSLVLFLLFNFSFGSSPL